MAVLVLINLSDTWAGGARGEEEGEGGVEERVNRRNC